MTSVASRAAGARGQLTEFKVSVPLTPDDLKMIRAFMAWNAERPTCSPKKNQIERGFGVHRFAQYKRSTLSLPQTDSTGPRVFARLVALHVIEHSRNGHVWLTEQGKRVAELLAPETTP